MKNFKNILVISHENMGDIIMSSAALKMLREQYPEAKISLRTSKACAQTLFDPSVVNAVFGETVPTDLIGRQLYKLRVFLHCRREKYDLCFFFGHPKRSTLKYYRLAGIPVIVAPSNTLSGNKSTTSLMRYSTHIVPLQGPLDVHVVDYYQDIVQGFTCRGHRQFPYAVLEDPSFPGELEPGRTKKRIALCFRGNKNNPHLWPMEYFKTLVTALSNENVFFYAAIPPDEFPAVYEACRSHDLPVTLIQTPSLQSCLRLLKHTDLLISINTGQTHLAAALRVPVLSLSGKDGSSTYPYSTTGTIVSVARNCECCPLTEPCDFRSKTAVPGYAPPCITALTPEKVLPIAQNMLNGVMPQERVTLV